MPALASPDWVRDAALRTWDEARLFAQTALRFTTRPGRFAREWASFDRLSRGDLIGMRKDGTRVLAEEDGYIVFPNPLAQAGQEWFYLARTSSRAWLPDPG